MREHALPAKSGSRLVLHVLCPLIVISFFASIAMAVAHFPTDYDMRYRWISSLASARDNPLGHRYIGGGLICMSLLSVPVVWFEFGRLVGLQRIRRAGHALAYVGAAGLCSLGMEAVFFPNAGPVRLVHQVSTVLGFGGYALSFACLVYLTARDAAADRARRLYLGAAGLLIATPLVATSICNVVWYLTDGNPALFGSDYPKRLPLVLFSYAFWEWMLIIDLVFVLYLTVWYRARAD